MAGELKITRPGDRLIVALDVADIAAARDVVDALGQSVTFYKIGYQLAFAGGLEFARDLLIEGKRVFLDMKLLDIDHTIARAVENIAKTGVHMLTLHAYPKAMRVGVEAARGSGLCLLGVTVLTSMDDGDLFRAGYKLKADELVLRRAEQAREVGMGGVVASALEATRIREIIGDDMAIVTPGIRPKGADTADQKRVMTPGDAIAAGASHLVIGRPIIAAADPVFAARAVLSEIAASAG